MIEQLAKFFQLYFIVDNAELANKYSPVERTRIFPFSGFHYLVAYQARIARLIPEDECIVCKRPAHHTCIISVHSIIGQYSTGKFDIDLRTYYARALREKFEEELLHRQPLCLFGDCIRPPLK